MRFLSSLLLAVLAVFLIALPSVAGDIRFGKAMHRNGGHAHAEEAPHRLWASLKGLDASSAVESIKQQRPELNVVLVPEGSMVTMDFREDRVRIWHDEAGKVTRAPRVG